jgi:hypothetical protein
MLAGSVDVWIAFWRTQRGVGTAYAAIHRLWRDLLRDAS